MMFQALILSSILIAQGETPVPPGACTTVEQMKAKPLPPSSSDSRAAVVHGALLYFGDAFAGALYATGGGTVWYQGAGKFSQPISDAARNRAMALLGISARNQGEAPIIALKPNFAEILAPDVRVKGCF